MNENKAASTQRPSAETNLVIGYLKLFFVMIPPVTVAIAVLFFNVDWQGAFLLFVLSWAVTVVALAIMTTVSSFILRKLARIAKEKP